LTRKINADEKVSTMIDSRLQDTNSDKIQSVTIVKGFHLYTRRNEWVNWNGDTDLVRRSYKEYKCTLRDAEHSAEEMRTPGTRFFIDEFPLVSVRGCKRMILISEVFTESPMIVYDSTPPSLTNITNLGDIEKSLQDFKWSVISNYEANTILTTDDDPYFARESSPGKGKNSLAWTLKVRKINKAGVAKLVDCFKQVMEQTIPEGPALTRDKSKE
jgi:hypothetical protein